ncbi:MAG: hypothetical protein H6591_01665 [Flavobacteriales bacterium]|nr:hypothetical protein [Flavobacteriales bacterium]
MASEPASKRFNEEQALFSWWLVCAMCAVAVRLLSTGIVESGDGVQHYQIARFSWSHPMLLLHHWGKPLFTLLSSPFAQLGQWGMALFNATCFVATCWAADGVLRRSSSALRWLFAPMLLLVPVYGGMVLGGMTEILFGALALVTVRLLTQERFALALSLASFLPFSRPEYVAFIPFAALWTIHLRQWKSLPWLLLGNLVYGIIGDFAFGDPLWAFRQDPYTGAADIYGSGDPLHFIAAAPAEFGAPLLWLLALAAPLLCWLVIRAATREDALRIVTLALLPALAIIAVHSFLWWKGLKGSLGLTRVLATAAPFIVLCVCWTLGAAIRSRLTERYHAVIAVASVLLYAPWAWSAFQATQDIPRQADAYERFIMSAGEHAQELVVDGGRLIYFHPSIGLAAERDPFDKAHTLVGLPANWREGGLRHGDLIAWDAHFGPNEGATPLETLLEESSLELVGMMAPEERMEVLGGHPFEVYFFRKGGALERFEDHRILFQSRLSAHAGSLRMDTLRCETAASLCFAGTEYPLSMEALELDAPGVLLSKLRVHGQLTAMAAELGEVNLVFAEESDQGKLSYWSERIHAGSFDVRFTVPPRDCRVRNKLYLWHLSAAPFRIDSLRIEASLLRTK